MHIYLIIVLCFLFIDIGICPQKPLNNHLFSCFLFCLSMVRIQLEAFRTALSHIFRRLGEVLSEGQKVSISFSIGTLIGHNGILDFEFNDVDQQQAQSPSNNRLAQQNSTPQVSHQNNSPFRSTQRPSSRNGMNLDPSEIRNLRAKYPFRSPNRGTGGIGIDDSNGIRGQVRGGPRLRDSRQHELQGLNHIKHSLNDINSQQGGYDRPSSSGSYGNQHAQAGLPNSSSFYVPQLRGESPLKLARQQLEQKQNSPYASGSYEPWSPERSGEANEKRQLFHGGLQPLNLGNTRMLKNQSNVNSGILNNQRAPHPPLEDKKSLLNDKTNNLQKQPPRVESPLPVNTTPIKQWSPTRLSKSKSKNTIANKDSPRVKGNGAEKASTKVLASNNTPRKANQNLETKKSFSAQSEDHHIENSEEVLTGEKRHSFTREKRNSISKPLTSGMEALVNERIPTPRQQEHFPQQPPTFLQPQRPSSRSGGMGKRKMARPHPSLPPILDGFARTQAAPYTATKGFQSISAKIASFLTPEACLWIIDTHIGKIQRAGSVPFIANRDEKTVDCLAAERYMTELGLEEEPLNHHEQLATEHSNNRFQMFVKTGFSNATIAPIKVRWIRRALRKLNTQVPDISEEVIENMVRGMLEEMENQYKTSMKVAILDYILRNNLEAKRLGIPIPPPRAVVDWGKGLVPIPPAASSRTAIQRAFEQLHRNLKVNNPVMLELLHIWLKYENETLFLPRSDDNTACQSIKLFEQNQQDHMQDVHSKFATDWSEEVFQVFTNYKKHRRHMTEVSSRPLFNCAQTLMSNQLRSIVQNSVEQLHKFIMQYRQCPGLQFEDQEEQELCGLINTNWVPANDNTDDNSDNKAKLEENDVNNLPRPLFIFTLTPRSMRDQEGGNNFEIAFDTNVDELEHTVDRTFISILERLSDLTNVKHKVFPVLDEDTTYLLLNVEGSAGDNIQVLREEIRTVVQDSIREAKSLLNLYSEFTYLLDEEKKVAEWLLTQHTLEQYRARIDQYRSIAELLTERTVNTIRGQLILFDCASVNKLLIDKANELAKKICEHISLATKNDNSEITEEYRGIERKLVKNTTETQELVDLVRYVADLKSQKRAVLEKRCQNIRERVLFLLDLDFNHHVIEEEALKYMWTTWRCLVSDPKNPRIITTCSLSNISLNNLILLLCKSR